MNRAAAACEGLRRATAELSIRIQQVVGTGADQRCYVVRVDRGRVTLSAGRDPDAEVTVTEDATTAAALARGDLTPQAAFMTGAVRVGGDIPALLACYEALAGADDAFGGVRAATTY